MIVVIEGPDGSGKSTQAKMLAASLGWPLQRFPDRSTPVGRLIDMHLRRHVALGLRVEGLTSELRHYLVPATSTDDALMFQALMTANRVEHHRPLRLAAVGMADLVCDRYTQSFLVYGGADGLDVDHLKRMAEATPAAQLNVLVRVPPEVSVQRLAARGDRDRYEVDPGFVKATCRRYDALWAEHTGEPGWVTVDGTKPAEKVHEEIATAVVAWNEE